MTNSETDSEYFDENGCLDVDAAIAALIKARSYDSNICIGFHGLNRYDIWLNTGDLILEGGLREYLTYVLDEKATDEILNRDCEVVDSDDDLVSWFCGNYGTFDWGGYAEAFDEYTKAGINIDAFSAGIHLGIPADKVLDAYIGEYKNDEEFAECHLYSSLEIPESIVNYIDWEAVARDYSCDFHSLNDFYFSTNY